MLIKQVTMHPYERYWKGYFLFILIVLAVVVLGYFVL